MRCLGGLPIGYDGACLKLFALSVSTPALNFSLGPLLDCCAGTSIVVALGVWNMLDYSFL